MLLRTKICNMGEYVWTNIYTFNRMSWESCFCQQIRCFFTKLAKGNFDLPSSGWRLLHAPAAQPAAQTYISSLKAGHFYRVSYESWDCRKILCFTKLVGGSFNLPTSELWAQHAAAAPLALFNRSNFIECPARAATVKSLYFSLN